MRRWEHRSDPSYLRHNRATGFLQGRLPRSRSATEQEGLLSCIHMHPPMFDPHTSADCTVGSRSSGTASPRGPNRSACSAAKFPLPLSSSCNPYRNTVALRGFKELEELKRRASKPSTTVPMHSLAKRNAAILASSCFSSPAELLPLARNAGLCIV